MGKEHRVIHKDKIEISVIKTISYSSKKPSFVSPKGPTEENSKELVYI